MKTNAYHIMINDRVLQTFRSYNAITTEWIDSVIGCALLKTPGIRFTGAELQAFYDGQQAYLADRIKFFTADHALAYDTRTKRQKQADEDERNVEAVAFVIGKSRDLLADIGFTDTNLKRLEPPMQTGWKKLKEEQKELLRLIWWRDNGLRSVRAYVLTSLIHLREQTLDGGNVRFGPKRLDWIYGEIAEGLQEYYKLFFKATQTADDHIREEIESRHRVMKAAGIQFENVKCEGLDTIMRPPEQDDKTTAAQRKKARQAEAARPQEPLPSQYIDIMNEVKKGKLGLA